MLNLKHPHAFARIAPLPEKSGRYSVGLAMYHAIAKLNPIFIRLQILVPVLFLDRQSTEEGFRSIIAYFWWHVDRNEIELFCTSPYN
jgi:hypothetical protein